MEKRDEDQILAEAQGNIIKEMFYKFKIGGVDVTGISWVGTKEIARRYGGIKMGIPQVTDLGEDWACSVQATDLKNDVTLVGSSLQTKNMKRRDGSEGPDRFAYTKVVSKAQRSAIRALIPESFLLSMEKTFSAEKSKPRKVDSTSSIPVWDGDLSIPNIQAYLIANGFEGEKFKLHHDEVAGMFIIDSAPFTNDFDLQIAVVKEMGGEYNREMKKTVFKY